MFCVEHGFEEHLPAFKWALTHLLSEGDHAHLVTVIPPLDFTPVSGEAARARDGP